VVAISGITRERLGALAGIAIAKAGCIGAVAGAPDPAKEMKAINSILEKRYDTENRGS
jgi:thiamine monophosphate synthase